MEISDFKHGDSVQCTISGKEILDAKVSFDAQGRMYICQNECSGNTCTERFGYKYSWITYRPGKSLEEFLKEKGIYVTNLVNLTTPIPEGEIVSSQIDTESQKLIKDGVSRI